MPLYDLICMKCGGIFEVLVHSRNDLTYSKIKCPKCKSMLWDKLPSKAEVVIK